jgi:hypothetical protein
MTATLTVSLNIPEIETIYFLLCFTDMHVSLTYPSVLSPEAILHILLYLCPEDRGSRLL